MPDDGFLVDVLGGVPVVAAPEEIDITNAEALRSAQPVTLERSSKEDVRNAAAPP